MTTYVKRDPKPRLVAVAPVADRVVEQSFITEIGPTFERSFLDDSFGCRTGRGPLRATLRGWRWMRRYHWVLHLDVRSYFASIDHRILRRLYASRLRDERALGLLDRLLAVGGSVYHSASHLGGPKAREGLGLPVGSLVSHFSGALYLDRLDHYVKHELKVPAYLRFMDDMLLVADEREELAEAWSAVAEWLGRERALTLKPTREGIVSTRAGLTLLGWRVTRAGLRPARTGRRRLLRRLRHRAAQGPEAVRDALAAVQHRWRFG